MSFIAILSSGVARRESMRIVALARSNIVNGDINASPKATYRCSRLSELEQALWHFIRR